MSSSLEPSRRAKRRMVLVEIPWSEREARLVDADSACSEKIGRKIFPLPVLQIVCSGVLCCVWAWRDYAVRIMPADREGRNEYMTCDLKLAITVAFFVWLWFSTRQDSGVRHRPSRLKKSIKAKKLVTPHHARKQSDTSDSCAEERKGRDGCAIKRTDSNIVATIEDGKLDYTDIVFEYA